MQGWLVTGDFRLPHRHRGFHLKKPKLGIVTSGSSEIWHDSSFGKKAAYEPSHYFLLYLIHGALVRPLVRAPSEDGRAMPEPTAREVIVGHLDHVFGLH